MIETAKLKGKCECDNCFKIMSKGETVYVDESKGKAIFCSIRCLEEFYEEGDQL